MHIPPPLCVTCRFWHRANHEAFTCDAYPDGIPEEIIQSEHDHHEPFRGDGGIQYKPLQPSKEV